jgi:hypothetical protein
MEIRVLKTADLTDNDWIQIESGFNQSFNKKTTKERLVNLYTSSILNYSYHSICSENDKIIGFTSIIPFQYLYNKQVFKAGLSCSSFVLKEYRNDAFLYKDMCDSLIDACAKDDFLVILGVPNKNSHKYRKVFLGAKDIGFLPYYALPLRFSSVFKNNKYKFLDTLSAFCAGLLCNINLILSYLFNYKEKTATYRLLFTEEFYKVRFSASCYSYYEKKNIRFWYRIVEEDRIKTAYLMEFREKKRKNK